MKKTEKEPMCIMKTPKGNKIQVLCGYDERFFRCGSCGFNPAENERRNGIALETLTNGLLGKVLRKGSC